PSPGPTSFTDRPLSSCAIQSSMPMTGDRLWPGRLFIATSLAALSVVRSRRTGRFSSPPTQDCGRQPAHSCAAPAFPPLWKDPATSLLPQPSPPILPLTHLSSATV